MFSQHFSCLLTFTITAVKSMIAKQIERNHTGQMDHFCLFITVFPVLNVTLIVYYISIRDSETYLYHPVKKKSSEDDIPKILILSQARSGSSFLGSMMSAHDNAYYLFEPFWKMNVNKTPLDDLIDDNHVLASKAIENVLNKIYNCGNISFLHLVQLRSYKSLKNIQ